MITACRDCKTDVSGSAKACPKCGALSPSTGKFVYFLNRLAYYCFLLGFIIILLQIAFAFAAEADERHPPPFSCFDPEATPQHLYCPEPWLTMSCEGRGRGCSTTDGWYCQPEDRMCYEFFDRDGWSEGCGCQGGMLSGWTPD